ncbi:probable inactive serine/threonine-protein kinase scy1 isoform X1 [Tanacetum coccineum]|uniref:Probable inactive serine/threonine-protein kinase scy1 isoform X1 n=1 Tax=Tanacetum coccineum TaxID=301880 RepID=A0ABQ4YFV1_9ASTR
MVPLVLFCALSYGRGLANKYYLFFQDDGSPVSIFSLTGSNANDGHLAAGRNGVKRLRTVSHQTYCPFFTYRAEIFRWVRPQKVLLSILSPKPVYAIAKRSRNYGLQGNTRNEYYAWGLYRIAKAVSFLNNDCKLFIILISNGEWHGNVWFGKWVVRPTLDWKLHAFDTLSEFDGNNEVSTGPMLQYEWLIGSQYKPMELAKADWATIRKSPPWAIDSWGLGCLIYEIFAGLKLSKTEELRNTSSIPKSLLPDYQRLLSSMPSRRLNSSKLAENCEYFQNKLVDTIHFMEILNLKDSVEKDTFFRKLPTLAEQLPREIVAEEACEKTRKRVLINAFTVRALRDTFPHARGAGLMALCATSSYYDAQEIAARILPNVVVLTIDPDSMVITIKGLQTVEQFLQIVKAYHEKGLCLLFVAIFFSDTYAGNGTESTGSGITSLPGNASNFGWAMSSLTTKSKPSEQTAPLPPKSTSPLVTAVSNASSDTPSRILVRTASSGSDIGDQDMYSQPAPVSPTSTDGWGELENGINEDHESEKDAWDDMLPLEDEKPSPALANIQAAQKRPVMQTKPQASIPRPKSTSHVGNADDDLWGSIAAPPPKVGAKPLNANPSPSLDNDDPWAAIAAPPPTTRA